MRSAVAALILGFCASAGAPRLGALLPCQPVPNELLMIAAGQMGQHCTATMNGTPFTLATVDGTHIAYAAVRSDRFETPDGIPGVVGEPPTDNDQVVELFLRR